MILFFEKGGDALIGADVLIRLNMVVIFIALIFLAEIKEKVTIFYRNLILAHYICLRNNLPAL